MLAIFLTCFLFDFWVLLCIAKTPDLGAPHLLNVTRDLNVFFSGTSVDNITYPLEGCFRQAPPQEPQIFRTSFIDCFGAVNMIAALHISYPIRFRRHDDSTFILPHRFSYRTCLVFLDMVSADAEDTFYMTQIMDVAIDTARRCTAHPTALGGRGLAGPRKLMEVLVVGRPWPWSNGSIDTILLDDGDNDDAAAVA